MRDNRFSTHNRLCVRVRSRVSVRVEVRVRVWVDARVRASGISASLRRFLLLLLVKDATMNRGRLL